jgi:hypothetical protein
VLLFGAFLGLVGVAFTLASLVDAGIDVVRRDGARLGRRTALRLGASALAFAIWPIAGEIAEQSTGWSDRDHNGILDPFTNGSFDWVDVNGGRALAIFGAGALILVCSAAFAAERLK